MSTITAKELVSTANMSTRPEYYSGRGAILGDLSGEQLFTIYNGIKEKLGEEQATAFVTMIENIKSLSATNFLNCLYALEASDWVYRPFEESDIDIGPDGPEREIIAFATTFTGLSSFVRDDTDYIRGTFFKLIKHKDAKANSGKSYTEWPEWLVWPG